MRELGIDQCGVASREERLACAGRPSAQRMAQGAVAVIECVQGIPCNPCEAACPKKAIRVGNPITNCPALDEKLCIGCGLCIARCPGLAIFVVNEAYSETEATVSLPYEYWPLPAQDDVVDALDRYGRKVGEARVVQVVSPPAYAKTAVVTVAVEKGLSDDVRNIRGRK